MNEFVFINTPTPYELARRTRIEAARLGISRAALVRKALTDYLNRQTKKIHVEDGETERGG